MASSPDNYLYLYSTDLNYFPDNLAAFVQACQGFLFIDNPADNLGEHYYHVGEQFLQMVTFMGCSPYIKVYPEDDNDKNYCSVYIQDDSLGIRFINGCNNTGPRCTACKKLIQSDSGRWKKWQRGNEKYHMQCEHCGISTIIQQLNWKKNAGIVNFSLRISNIFPKEAIPTDQLLHKLKSITGVDWKYFYT